MSALLVRHVHNPRAAPAAAPYPDALRGSLSLAALAQARAEIGAWPGYAPTPLRDLGGLAARAGLGAIHYKDEAGRFGLGSFKALGGAYAVLRLLQRHLAAQGIAGAGAPELAAGAQRGRTAGVTVTCATDGNHGRAVAWGARTFGCRCVVYLHPHVSAGRERAIAALGAEIRRTAGTYDDAVRQADADAQRYGWQVVSDTSYPGYANVPREVMQGYGVLVAETLEQLGSATPTHAFVQGGVGGLAAAVCATLWERLGPRRPRVVVVEPERADCLFQSAVHGRPTAVTGSLDTVMAGLACGEVSLLAWDVLALGAADFLAISDEAALDTMRLLAAGTGGDAPVVAGESGVAGLAGLLAACADEKLRGKLGLDAASRVLVIGSEGATDPDLYARIVGRTPEEVLAGGRSSQ